ncbi:DUF4263 domain-containing protein [Pseudomonas sp. P135]|uniref:Shedu immune nuclease family protein n=1 Tax=Pseudomonas sp. P135 TaxID=2730420 RepID=UPI000DAC1FA7|nr:Shedu immune nuclease family protein [Pseudomonas sp. P135]MCA5971860.1 DUF4263 domain-containing protein [Pseudomonas sp. P135]
MTGKLRMDVREIKHGAASSGKRSAETLPGSREAMPLLTELRQEMLREITSGEKRAATDEEITTWILKKYQDNASAGDIYRALLSLGEDYVSPSAQLPSSKAALEQLHALEHYPIPEYFFVSTDYEDEFVGFLFQREALRDGGRVYSVTGFDSCDLGGKVSRLELRVNAASPEPFISRLSNNGWIRVSKEVFSKNDYLDLIFRSLAAYCNYKNPRIDTNRIIDTRLSKPAENDYLVRLIADAFKGTVPCTRIRIPITRILPRDIDYTLSIAESEIKSFMRRIATWGAPLAEILLYEENGHLTMDDDYVTYCAYRALEVNLITAVVVGNFDESNIKILARGHGELIPPIQVNHPSKRAQTHTLSKDEQLDRKLLALIPTSSSKNTMKRKFTDFCRLLGKDSTLEKDLHKFIKNHPEIFDCHFGKIHMEVPIGNFRADMVLEYDQSHRRILLVELERHVDQIFTKDNRLRSKVTHAGQQVEDWIGEIRGGKDNVPDWLSKEYVVEGAIVIGRSKNLTLRQKETLRVINTNRTIKIMTYDDLLEQMMRLISILS